MTQGNVRMILGLTLLASIPARKEAQCARRGLFPVSRAELVATASRAELVVTASSFPTLSSSVLALLMGQSCLES